MKNMKGREKRKKQKNRGLPLTPLSSLIYRKTPVTIFQTGGFNRSLTHGG
jgi:hypothetical protein